MRTLEKIALVGVLPTAVLIALLLSGTLPGTARETSQPTSLAPPLEEWKTYTDDQFHFTFKYPPDWYLNVLPADADVGGGYVQLSTYDLHDTSFLKGTPPSDYLKIEIVVVGDPRAPGQSLEEWRHARGDYDPSKPREERHVTVAGLAALEETVEHYPGMRITTIYLPYSDPTYGNTVLYISVSPFRQPILSEVFRQIVSTFQFVR